MVLHIKLLGGCALTVDGGPAIALKTRKAEALLAILAVRPGTRYTRERLAAWLWPNRNKSQARSNLRQTVAILRAALRPARGALIDARGDALALEPAGVMVDVPLFEAAIAVGSRESLEQVTALYAGDFLDGLDLAEDTFEEWRNAEAARLRDLALRGLGRLLEIYVETGDVEKGLALGERLLTLDPGLEDAHRALMRFHLRRGARNAALRQYERCKQVLQAEFGVTPELETERLRREALTQGRLYAATQPDVAASILVVVPSTEGARRHDLARAVAADLVHGLSRFRPFRVMPLHGPVEHAEAFVPVELGNRYGAQFVVTGALCDQDDGLRLSVELIAVETGHCIWSQREAAGAGEGLAGAMPNLVSALVIQIDGFLLRTVQGQEAGTLSGHVRWLVAFEAFQRGPQGRAQAAEQFRQLLTTDPRNCRAHAGLALFHLNEWSPALMESSSLPRAFEHAQRAVELDRTDHLAHFALGQAALLGRNFEMAERHFDRSEQLNDCDPETLIRISMARASLGQPDRGVALAQRAMALNPMHDSTYFGFAALSYFAADDLERGLALAANASLACTAVRACAAAAHAAMGRLVEGRQEVEAFVAAFRRNILAGRVPDREEPGRWLLHVLPFRPNLAGPPLLRALSKVGLHVPLGPCVWGAKAARK